MSGKNIRTEQFFKPVKMQSNKTNDVREDGIEKTPQSQTRKVDSSKLYHPGKDFRSSENVWQPKVILPAWMIQKVSMVRL